MKNGRSLLFLSSHFRTWVGHSSPAPQQELKQPDIHVWVIAPYLVNLILLNRDIHSYDVRQTMISKRIGNNTVSVLLATVGLKWHIIWVQKSTHIVVLICRLEESRMLHSHLFAQINTVLHAVTHEWKWTHNSWHLQLTRTFDSSMA